MKKLLLTFLLLCSFVTFNANAGIHLEPYLNVMDKSTASDDSAGSSDTDISGMSFGARIGYSFAGFWAGLDYETAGSKTGEDDSGDYDITQTNTALAAGITIVPMVNVFAKYILKASLTQDSSAMTEMELTGSGIGIGVGFTVAPMVSLNLEYKTLTFDEFAQGSNSGDLTDEVKLTGFQVGISVPFSL